MPDLFISGLTGTFDTEGMVSKLIQIKQRPLTQLTQQKAIIQGRVASMNNLYGALTSMQSFFNNIDLNSLFSSKKASSSNSSVLTATATKDTPNITMGITVNSLSQTEIRTTKRGVQSLLDKFSSSGKLTLKYWIDNSNYQSFYIDYTNEHTLQDLVNMINSAQNKVKASIYYTGTDYRLLLTETDVANSTRETNDTGSNEGPDTTFVIEIDSLPEELVALETMQEATNASITIGNSNSKVTSASNIFSNILPGLEITIKERGSATLTISEDYSKANNTLNNFVSNYNAILSVVNSMTGKGAQFQGDSTITTIKTGMVRLIDPLIKAGIINYSDKDGTISINDTALNNLSSSNPHKLKEIISKLKENFSGQLSTWTSSISTYKNIGEVQIRNINQKISNLQNYLVKYEERLRKEYAQLEAFINQTNQISSRIQDFMKSLSEMTKGDK